MMRGVKLRRVLKGLRATDDQSEEFIEAMDDFATKDYLHQELKALEGRLFNKMVLALIALGGVIMGAIALID